MKPLCIYHADCLDGFAAALAVYKYYGKGNVDFHRGVRGEPPPDVTGREVFLVDFSYKRDLLFNMARTAESITILDHHISAYRDLFVDSKSELPENIMALFDMEKSGAVITWEFFHKDPVPELFLHIQDRDLWKFELAGTREISAALFSYDYDFDLWGIGLLADLSKLYEEGKVLHRKLVKDVKGLVASSQHRFVIQGFDVPVLNTSHFMSSEAGDLMGKNEPFAACYWFSKDSVHFSLRSAKDGVDVSKIAGKYSGGGHTHAAGFRVPINQFVKEFLSSPDEGWQRLAMNSLLK